MDESGKILMEENGKMAAAPNGNGAVFDSIKKSVDVQKALKNIDYV